MAAFGTYINLRQDLGAESARSDDRFTEILSAACVCVPTEGVKKPSGTYLQEEPAFWLVFGSMCPRNFVFS